MKPNKSRPASAPTDRRRSRRARPTPRWLIEQQDLNEMARRRTMLVLSVLSGEKAVTDAIEEAGISRPLYYQLETKALHAMLRALAPGSSESTGTPGADGMLKRISELEEQVKHLTQEKRRCERLLFLTRKVVKKGPVASPVGRPRKAKSSSTSSGPRSSTPSTPAATPLTPPSPSSPSSTPTRDGATSP